MEPFPLPKVCRSRRTSAQRLAQLFGRVGPDATSDSDFTENGLVIAQVADDQSCPGHLLVDVLDGLLGRFEHGGEPTEIFTM